MNSDNEDYEQVKVILLGESGTGKTSLINVAVGRGFSEDSCPTVASNFSQMEFTINNKKYKLNIWDTAGQEKYRAMTRLFIKESNIVIFVYSIDNKATFEGLSYWVKFAKDALGDKPIYAIFGNKSDLIKNEEVSSEKIAKYSEEVGIQLRFVSAKEDGPGIAKFIEILFKQYLKKMGIVIQPKKKVVTLKNNNETASTCC